MQKYGNEIKCDQFLVFHQDLLREDADKFYRNMVTLMEIDGEMPIDEDASENDEVT